MLINLGAFIGIWVVVDELDVVVEVVVDVVDDEVVEVVLVVLELDVGI